ncbi:trypsin-like serine protease [Lujinxingia vulgaris]|uniref:Trypsin-like serine protease n=1 Tax=Lujinxingia vulgaris TaxID=2600176 RepID=A0A5C6X7R4_9DELT|nr:trypsin-like peptidase domain-containing protein [Lujinxingia vulgaris]TXD35149.1 trypsin-like serine protease [Lujinxingia vulgaris]
MILNPHTPPYPRLAPGALRLLPILIVGLATTLLCPAPAAAQEAAPDTTEDAAPNPMLRQLQREQRAIFTRVAPSVVFLTHAEGLGSGFFVSSDGLILTNAHVVGEHSRVEVVLHDGRRVTGEVIERAEDIDLALVKVDVKNVPTLRMAGMHDVAVGDWAAAVGHGRGAIWTFTTGMISNIYPAGDERPLFQTQIPLNPGSSGGPVVNIDGDAIGVVTAGLTDAQSINFAIPLQQAIAHLPALSERCDCLVVNLPPNTPLYVNDVLAGTGPRVVLMVEEGSYALAALINGRLQRRTVRWPASRSVTLGD